MTTTPEEAVTKFGFDPGEWIQDWVRQSIKNADLALPLGMTGPTGTGKSNFLFGILWNCVEQGDCVVLPGDIACEFRHFFKLIPQQDYISIRIILPQQFEYRFFVTSKEKSYQTDFKELLELNNAEVIIYNPYEQSINNFIEPATILVVMDAGFNLESKSWFWYYNLKQLKSRVRYNYIEVTYAFPEASTYWPNTPFTEQFKPVYLFSKDIVDHRKLKQRGVFLYHHSSMFFYLLEKQIETVIKKGSAYEVRFPYDNKYGKGKRIDQYSIIHQGIEDIMLDIKGKFPEMDVLWKFIPLKEIDFLIHEDEEEYDKKEAEKKQKERDADLELFKQKQEEKLKNKEYIMETELLWKQKEQEIKQKEMEERKRLQQEAFEQKQKLQEQKHQQLLERQKERDKKKGAREEKQLQQVDKGLLVLQANTAITVKAFGDLVGLTNWNSAKKLYDQCQEILQDKTTIIKKESGQ